MDKNRDYVTLRVYYKKLEKADQAKEISEAIFSNLKKHDGEPFAVIIADALLDLSKKNELDLVTLRTVFNIIDVIAKGQDVLESVFEEALEK
ncbi:MAG: hypothetical protein KBT35_01435 [Firmicutes bacterium]|nr:hypothetical protein [Candidatus Colivicinus equi]